MSLWFSPFGNRNTEREKYVCLRFSLWLQINHRNNERQKTGQNILHNSHSTKPEQFFVHDYFLHAFTLDCRLYKHVKRQLSCGWFRKLWEKFFSLTSEYKHLLQVSKEAQLILTGEVSQVLITLRG